MSKINIVIIGFLFWVPLLFSQTTIKGKVVVKEQSAEGIHVLNLVSEKATITDEKGEFNLVVNEDDLIIFSAVHLNYWRRSISINDIKNGFIEVEMTSKEQILEEVVVTEYTKINAQELGIINVQPKSYTPAQRKLRPAQLKTIDFINFNSVLVPLDPLFYWVAGKTKLLKKELEVEKKEMLMLKLNQWNDDKFYTHELKIPEKYVEGFKIVIIYDKEVCDFLNTNNKFQGNFRIIELAEDFLKNLNTNE